MRSPPLPCPLASVRLSSASLVGPLIRAVEGGDGSAVSQRQPPGVTGASGWQPTARVYGQEPCVSMQRLNLARLPPNCGSTGRPRCSRARAFDPELAHASIKALAARGLLRVADRTGKHDLAGLGGAGRACRAGAADSAGGRCRVSLPWRIGCAADEEKRKSLPNFPRRHGPPGFSEA